MPLRQGTPPADEEFDIGDMLDTLMDGKLIIFVSLLICGAIAIAYILLARPIYQADALMQIESDESSMSAIFGDMGDALGVESEATTEIELIKSRLVLGRTIEQLRLNEQVEFGNWLTSAAQRSRVRLSGSKRISQWRPATAMIGTEILRLSRFEVPAAYYNEDFVLIAQADGSYQLLAPDESQLLLTGRQGTTEHDEATGISLAVAEMKLPAGRRMLLRVRDPLTAVDELRERLKVSEKAKDSGIIHMSLEAYSGAEAQSVLNAIANNYLRQNVERKGEEAEQTLQYLNSQLPELRGSVDAAEVQLNAYRKDRGSADMLQETELLLQQSAQLEASRLELEQQREQLLQRFQAQHPTVLALEAQLREVGQSRNALENKIRSLPETQQDLLRLTRDVQVNTELYVSLLNSAQQLEVAKAGTVGTVRIIDHAALPLESIRPQKMLALISAVALGLIIGISIIFLRRILYSTVDDPQVIEQEFGLPVYASIPMSKSQKAIGEHLNKLKPGMHTLHQEGQDDIALEAFKSLRTALHFGTHGADNNIILITGPRPGLGKTFVATNLGSAIAQSGTPTLVIDCDMRRGTLHNYIGARRRLGLSDYLSGSCGLRDIVRSTAENNLHFITTGTIPPNPSELLALPQFRDLLQLMSKKFAHIILDSPPNLAVADSGILAQSAASVLLVLQANAHPQREIAESLKRLKLIGASVRGVVLNKTPPTSRKYGYNRYHNYYAYKSTG